MSIMAHAPYLRDKARELRIAKRLSIDELADPLALSRSTIYYWVRDLPIEGSGSGGPFPTHGQKLGNRAMQRKYRLLRDEAYAEGESSFDGLIADPTFRDFVCLYMAEGSELLDPIPRRPGSGRAMRLLGLDPADRSRLDQAPAEVEQRAAQGPDMAL
jgi:hypothetical protein